MGRVLLVDDDATDRAEIAAILRTHGHEVALASNPDEALEKFESFRPDMAVIDYRCLDSSPSDDAGVLVAAQSDPLVPKIMISAYAEKEEIMRAVNTNVDGFALVVRFLAKPEIRSHSAKFLTAVTEAIRIRQTWLRHSREAIAPELFRQHRVAQVLMVAQILLIILAGAAFTALGFYMIMAMHATVVQGLIAIVGAVIGEALILILHKKSEPVFEMARQAQQEIVSQATFNRLFDACEKISSLTERDAQRRKLIDEASSSARTAGEPHVGRE